MKQTANNETSTSVLTFNQLCKEYSTLILEKIKSVLLKFAILRELLIFLRFGEKNN